MSILHTFLHGHPAAAVRVYMVARQSSPGNIQNKALAERGTYSICFICRVVNYLLSVQHAT